MFDATGYGLVTLVEMVIFIATVFVAPHVEPPAMALAWGVFAGGVLQLALQVPALMRIGMLPRFDLVFSDPPYPMPDADVAADLEALVAHGWLVPGALVIVERAAKRSQVIWPGS